MEKISLNLAGLDCPHCAEKIAARVEKINSVTDCKLNFINKRLDVTHSDNETAVVNQIEKIVHELEPDVDVLPFAENTVAEKSNHKSEIIQLCIAAVLFVTAFIFGEDTTAGATFAVVAYLVAGWEVVLSAVKNLVKGEAFDESLLMTIASLGAMVIGDFTEGAAVMLFFQVGELFQTIAVERSRKSITSLMELKPEYCNIEHDGELVRVDPETVKIGDEIIVKVGERCPLDGVVIDGKSSVDTSVLTGEFLPVEVKEGDKILSGCTNQSGTLKIRVESEIHESAVSRILDMVQNSSEKKAQSEKFITRFARVYTPVVVALAVVLAIVPCFFTGFSEFSTWLYRGLLFLVISCPCALVISVPLSFFAGVGRASKHGILIKGAKSMEGLAICKTVCFDKTGTLTKGKFTVVETVAEGMSVDKLVEYAAYAECDSTHPIGTSIVEKYGEKINRDRLSDVAEIAGNGVSCVLDGKRILCGKAKLLADNNVSVKENDNGTTAVYVAVDGTYAGRISLGDEIKAESAHAVSSLEKIGVEAVLLTGDKKTAAQKVADKLGIKNVRSELLPADKVTAVESLLSADGKKTVAFVGDGINDAPVIARADVGIAMGGLGSDIAIEAADVVIMNDKPDKISEAIAMSRNTMKVVRENIVFALAVKIAIMVLGAVGIAGMWFAVFADVGVSFICILNALLNHRKINI